MTTSTEELVEKVRSCLTPDLLRPDVQQGQHPMQGHCYVASEAIYHILGGSSSGLKPTRMRFGTDVHWWLVDSDGNVVDATFDQFNEPVPYEQGRAGGFLTREPSKRAKVLIERVHALD
jgi:hypothetical protein